MYQVSAVKLDESPKPFTINGIFCSKIFSLLIISSVSYLESLDVNKISDCALFFS